MLAKRQGVGRTFYVRRVKFMIFSKNPQLADIMGRAIAKNGVIETRQQPFDCLCRNEEKKER